MAAGRLWDPSRSREENATSSVGRGGCPCLGQLLQEMPPSPSALSEHADESRRADILTGFPKIGIVEGPQRRTGSQNRDCARRAESVRDNRAVYRSETTSRWVDPHPLANRGRAGGRASGSSSPRAEATACPALCILGLSKPLTDNGFGLMSVIKQLNKLCWTVACRETLTLKQRGGRPEQRHRMWGCCPPAAVSSDLIAASSTAMSETWASEGRWRCPSDLLSMMLLWPWHHRTNILYAWRHPVRRRG